MIFAPSPQATTSLMMPMTVWRTMTHGLPKPSIGASLDACVLNAKCADLYHTARYLPHLETSNAREYFD
jgi:hypothetical protein